MRSKNISIDNEKNTVPFLNQQLEIERGKNAILNNSFAKVMSAIRFYKDLPISNEYDKGFYKAFEIVEMILKGEFVDNLKSN